MTQLDEFEFYHVILSNKFDISVKRKCCIQNYLTIMSFSPYHTSQTLLYSAPSWENVGLKRPVPLSKEKVFFLRRLHSFKIFAHVTHVIEINVCERTLSWLVLRIHQPRCSEVVVRDRTPDDLCFFAQLSPELRICSCCRWN